MGVSHSLAPTFLGNVFCSVQCLVLLSDHAMAFSTPVLHGRRELLIARGVPHRALPCLDLSHRTIQRVAAAHISPALSGALLQRVLCVGDVCIHAHDLLVEAIVCRTEPLLGLMFSQPDRSRINTVLQFRLRLEYQVWSCSLGMYAQGRCRKPHTITRLCIRVG